MLSVFSYPANPKSFTGVRFAHQVHCSCAPAFCIYICPGLSTPTVHSEGRVPCPPLLSGSVFSSYVCPSLCSWAHFVVEPFQTLTLLSLCSHLHSGFSLDSALSSLLTLSSHHSSLGEPDKAFGSLALHSIRKSFLFKFAQQRHSAISLHRRE